MPLADGETEGRSLGGPVPPVLVAVDVGTLGLGALGMPELGLLDGWPGGPEDPAGRLVGAAPAPVVDGAGRVPPPSVEVAPGAGVGCATGGETPAVGGVPADGEASEGGGGLFEGGGVLRGGGVLEGGGVELG
ncbi:hypothetical protein I6A84_23480 [Frankia sp. CNm7]|uniref:Uncharacterized protein n=1 Tax=Frankia nepalensis TaxID=1836974 RepID=A0A937RRX5_9ACTN|nr:hypothetical protein [Frankia nepalensis]MBL7497844.1 hypothetical protein [Frankia nepalensis]MBL7509667.1 hypothetical protein [Frankia nepalensis]MBL7520968.1 hypothetical protein [Frankia nepalensis]MBL7630836.1 hypothetical protein [Frankia nepalensis]